MVKDKLADMYFSELNDMPDNKYIKDGQKIEQNQKVFEALIDILKQDENYSDCADQIMSAYVCCSKAHEIRAYKMGIETGQALSEVQA